MKKAPTNGRRYGAGNEARTRYLHLGKVALYQMSYARGTKHTIAERRRFVKNYFGFFHFYSLARFSTKPRRKWPEVTL